MSKAAYDLISLNDRIEGLEKSIESLVNLVQLFADRVREMDAFIKEQVEKAKVQ